MNVLVGLIGVVLVLGGLNMLYTGGYKYDTMLALATIGIVIGAYLIKVSFFPGSSRGAADTEINRGIASEDRGGGGDSGADTG